MWGIYLDSKAIQEGLFQTVIQYRIKENGEAEIILPETVYKPDMKYIRELPICLWRAGFPLQSSRYNRHNL